MILMNGNAMKTINTMALLLVLEVAFMCVTAIENGQN